MQKEATDSLNAILELLDFNDLCLEHHPAKFFSLVFCFHISASTHLLFYTLFHFHFRNSSNSQKFKTVINHTSSRNKITFLCYQSILYEKNRVRTRKKERHKRVKDKDRDKKKNSNVDAIFPNLIWHTQKISNRIFQLNFSFLLFTPSLSNWWCVRLQPNNESVVNVYSLS